VVIARTPLTRDRVAEAALARIDADGLDALSMRKLGADLGVEAMSLYNHVRNKDALLDLVGELLLQQMLDRFEAKAAGVEDWRERARAMATAWWEIGIEHPNAFTVVADRPMSGMVGVEMLACCMRLFTDAGSPIEDAVGAFQSAAAWVIGVVQQELNMITKLLAGGGFSDADVPPEYAALLDFKRICLETTSDVRFQRGLDVLLAGIEATFARP
jgi:TetR/AcrR family transcriptional regulator, tetracycline repressor protein